MRTLVIGDIHGGLKGLEQVLGKVIPKADDLFIFVGDYVDGWPDNAETISFLLDFSDNNNCIFLRGNHEELLYNYLKNGDNNPVWLEHGGEASKKSYVQISSAEKKKHLKFLENLLNYHIDGSNRVYLHAGFTNQHGPQYEYFPTMVYWDRTLWEMASAMKPDLNASSTYFPKRLKQFREIFIGHTPISKTASHVKPKHCANVWNLDTGAAYKGPITIMDVETKEFWQSDPIYTLYPQEKGRN